MPRSLILGDGGLTVLWDELGRIREYYYPGPGHDNHLQDGGIRFGVWSGNQLRWLDEGEWIRSVTFDLAGVGNWRFESELAISCSCRIDQCALWLDWSFEGRLVGDEKLFVSSRFNIGENDIGQTAAHIEASNYVIHFKENLGFVLSGSPESPIEQFACGIAGFDGAEGTWRDAEDGQLSGNPIAQGSVDSTVSFLVPRDGRIRMSIRVVENPMVPKPFFLLPPPTAHHSNPSNASYSEFEGLPDSIVKLANQSVSIILSHLDRGVVPVASLDRSVMSTNRAHYAHCWMRDSAQIVDLLLDLGDSKLAVGFLEFCESVLDRERPYYLQKYTVTGNLASTWHPWREGQLPVQADETAWVVKLAARAFSTNIIDSVTAERVLTPGAKWLAEFIDADGLPKPSWDLWEERCDIATNTVCATISALRAASESLTSLDPALGKELNTSAEKIRTAFIERLVDPATKSIRRRLSADDTVDVSTLAAIQLGIVEPHDPIATATMNLIRERLQIHEGIGGFARYEGDYYYRIHADLPGNPWVIATMWFAHVLLLRATKESDLEEPLNWLRWAVERANSAGILAEQYDPRSGVPLAVAPLAWSHAEFVKTALLYQATQAKLQAESEPVKP